MGEGALALMTAPLTIKGGRQLNAKLTALPEKLREAAGRRAARKAMAIVRTAARHGAQRVDNTATPEEIARNVYMQQSRRQSRRIGGVVMRVGISGGARRPMGPDPNASAQPGGDTRHWRYIELGTEKTPAQPFLRPALENNTQPVLDSLAVGLGAELDRIVKEL